VRRDTRDTFTAALLLGIREKYRARYAMGGTADQKRRARNKRRQERR
jgi:hypothetical protein